MILTKPKKSTTRKFELSLAVSLVGDEFGTLLEQLTAAPHGQSPQPRDVDVAVAEQSGVVERFDVDAVVLQPTLHLQRHREARNRALVPLKSALCRLCCKSILSISARNIDSRSGWNAQQRFKRTGAPIR
jgi:hypothetical protein